MEDPLCVLCGLVAETTDHVTTNFFWFLFVINIKIKKKKKKKKNKEYEDFLAIIETLQRDETR
jgi:hypothetical protein